MTLPVSRARRLPTIEDVARLAGVSTATVSRSLNSPDRVRAKTRQAVERAVLELGYTPNFAGQVLASNRTNTIGAIIPTMENAIFARAIQALQETLSPRRVTLLIATSQYSPRQEEEQIRALLARGVDGAVLIGSCRSDNVYKLLTDRGLPFVILWSAPQETKHFTVGFDNVAAAADVANRVMDKGHSRIAMISGLTADNDRAQARVRGVVSALKARGLTMPPQYLVECRYSLDRGEWAASQLLAGDNPPTAIICGNDVLAAGAMRAARKSGICIPDALSITGFDDIELSRAVSPPLATVRVPHRRMGIHAAERLMQWIETGIRPDSLELPTQFVERPSLASRLP